MKNVKDEVYRKIHEVVENTTDSYPQNWQNLPAVQYIEDENSVYERCENKERTAYLRYIIDIWDMKSTSPTAIAIDEKVSFLGLVRTSCKDVAEQSGYKHKRMVYEGIVDMDSDIVYWDR